MKLQIIQVPKSRYPFTDLLVQQRDYKMITNLGI